MLAGSVATLYVLSQMKIDLTGTGAAGRLVRGSGSVFIPETAGAKTHEYEAHLMLPENQRAAVDLVQRLAQERRAGLEIIDLGKVRRFLKRKLADEMGWTEFPVLVAPGGGTLVGSGNFTKRAVSEIIDRTRLLPGSKL